MKWAYYNEPDEGKAAWLRELIKADLIAEGEVDERGIEQVEPRDFLGFTQCHWFAGIGVWSYALRLAGIRDDYPIWTGSCPCPSFSSAGKGQGFDDARHLWPQWYSLIRECRPGTVLGEQVASAIQHGWLDLVSTDLEAEGYAIAAAVLGAHSAGAPHIRQRLYFVAHSNFSGVERHGELRNGRPGFEQNGATGLMAHTNGLRCGGRGIEHGGRTESRRAKASERGAVFESVETQRNAGSVEHSAGDGREQRRAESDGRSVTSGCSTSELANAARSRCEGDGQEQVLSGRTGIGENERAARPGSVNFWSDAEWLPCRDGKLRPVRPGTFPLASGTPARVLRLRGYGDSINAETAKGFIEAALMAGLESGAERG